MNLASVRHSAGFTLIEMLIVVAILGVLLGLLATGIKHSMVNAKKRRRNTEVTTLQTAIVNYWHDNNQWPLGDTPKSKREAARKSSSGTISFQDDNYVVFDCLAPKNTAYNPSKKQYLDFTTYYTWKDASKKGGSIRSLAEFYGSADSWKAGAPLVDYKGEAYKVTINLKENTVSVK